MGNHWLITIIKFKPSTRSELVLFLLITRCAINTHKKKKKKKNEEEEEKTSLHGCTNYLEAKSNANIMGHCWCKK